MSEGEWKREREREREREKMRKRMRQAVIIIHSLFPIKQAIFSFSFPLFLRELGNWRDDDTKI